MANQNKTQDPGNEGQAPRDPNAAAPASVGPTFAAPEDPVADLSREIAKMLPRSADQRVTCRRITGNHYRCNWWTAQLNDEHGNRLVTGLTATTHRVTKSQFIHATKAGGTVAITPSAST